MSLLTRRGLAAGNADLRSLSTQLFQAFAWVQSIRAVRRQRQQLLALDDRMLSDIGVSRADAWNEARRPLSDLPNTRRVF